MAGDPSSIAIMMTGNPMPGISPVAMNPVSIPVMVRCNPYSSTTGFGLNGG